MADDGEEMQAELGRRTIEISGLREDAAAAWERVKEARERNESLQQSVNKLQAELELRKVSNAELEQKICKEEDASRELLHEIDEAHGSHEAEILELEDGIRREKRLYDELLNEFHEVGRKEQDQAASVEAEIARIEALLADEEQSSAVSTTALQDSSDRRKAAQAECEALSKELTRLTMVSAEAEAREALTLSRQQCEALSSEALALRSEALAESESLQAELDETIRSKREHDEQHRLEESGSGDASSALGKLKSDLLQARHNADFAAAQCKRAYASLDMARAEAQQREASHQKQIKNHRITVLDAAEKELAAARADVQTSIRCATLAREQIGRLEASVTEAEDAARESDSILRKKHDELLLGLSRVRRLYAPEETSNALRGREDP